MDLETLVLRFYVFLMSLVLASMILVVYALWEQFGPIGWCLLEWCL